MEKQMTVQECLGHYLSEKDPEDLAKFCGTKPRSVLRWDKNVPKGLGLVKSIAFLSTKEGYNITGYKPGDLEFQAILAIGYNYATVSEMASYLDLSHDYDLYRFLFKKRSMSNEKKGFLKYFLADSSQDLAKIIKLKEEKEADVSGFISDFKALSELLFKVEENFDQLISASPETRRKVRAKLEESDVSFFKSSNALFRVLDKMNALCSEKSKTEKNY